MVNPDLRKPFDLLPDYLLELWGHGQAAPASVSTTCLARGRKGPGDGSDFKAALLKGLGFAAGAMMQISTLNQSQINSSRRVSASSCTISRSPSPDIRTRSSSPPAPEDELDVCISQFSNSLTRKLPSDVLEHASIALKDEAFDVQLLGQGSSTDIMHLTGLRQGPAGGLKRFAKEYDMKLKGKHSCRK